MDGGPAPRRGGEPAMSERRFDLDAVRGLMLVLMTLTLSLIHI